MAQIYATFIHERIPESVFHHLLSCIAPDKRERICRYRHHETARQSLAAEILVRTLACRMLSLHNNQLSFKKNSWGKPYLAGSHDFHFNVSHSNAWVICAVDSLPVGLDIELVAPVNLTIADRFFAAPEVRQLHNLPAEMRLDRFYELWTLKESYIKSIGKGLSIPLSAFAFHISPDGQIRLVTSLEHEPVYFRQYDLDPRYKLSVCLRQAVFPDEIVRIPFRELVREFQSYST